MGEMTMGLLNRAVPEELGCQQFGLIGWHDLFVGIFVI